MADSEDTHQALRAEADSIRLGQIPQNAFSTLMDNAVLHASQTVAADAQAASNPWRNLGPRNIGGRIRALAIHPRNGRILYAGSALGGVWKTENAGDSWVPLDDFRPANNARQALPVGAIAISQSNPEVIYVGTGEPVNGYISGNGLFRSTNGGRHFTQIDHPQTGTIQAHHYERIRVDPWNQGRIWCAAFTNGLWRSRPGAFPGFVQDVIDAPGIAAAGQTVNDVVINWGDPRGTPPNQFTVFVALQGQGVFQATFIRANDAYDTSGATVWTQVNIPGLAALPSFNRVKITLCETRPLRMYCVAGDNNNRFSNVFRSNNGGTNWVPTTTQPGSTTQITWYALVLECHPTNADTVFLGQMNMWCTNDGGATWGNPNPLAGNPGEPNFLPCLDWTRYDGGDRAQHADQHAVVFDRDKPHYTWVGNDGGISLTTNLGGAWRKRSHGILATQFVDISSHPTYPFMMGGGLQDNGTWITYGGMSWYHVSGGDGGDLGFEPGNPRLYHVSYFPNIPSQGIARGQMGAAFVPPGLSYPNPVPDIPLAVVPNGVVRADTSNATGFGAGDNATFYGVLVRHPSNATEALVGRVNRAYRTTNGQTFAALGHAGLTAHGAPTSEISCLAYGPSPNNDWWVGSSTGEIFYTANGGGAWNNAIEPLASRGSWIAAIATHPTNSAIAAIAVTSNPGTLYLTGDGGTTWLEISGRAGAGGANWAASPAAGALDTLNPGPITAVAFDPRSDNGLASAQTLFAGTLTGVYVIRNAVVSTTVAPAPTFQPVWRTYNSQLPLALVYDMEARQFQDASGTQHNRLLIGTFGRGVYEADLSNASATRLLIRQTVDDNGYSLPNLNTMGDDPRLAPGTNFTATQAIDIRVDSKPFLYFGQVAEPVEFDQQLRSTDLISGEVNLVYVQVNNVGSLSSNSASVSLYWAEASGAPPAAPDLPSDFWTGFPQASAAPWELIQTQTISAVSSAKPGIVRFEWHSPHGLPQNVALLAIVNDATQDNLLSAPPAETVVATLVGAERRAALRIASTQARPADGLLRDGFDDLGGLGDTAWGARSLDIIVVPAAEANPNNAFSDTTDQRLTDTLVGSGTNHIYVRVRNKGSQVLNNVLVNIFQIPLASLADFSSWQAVGDVAIPSVAAATNVVTPTSVTLVNPADPGVQKKYLLAAVIGTADDPAPDPATRIDSVASFWYFFLQAVDSNNAAIRALPWQA